MDQNIADEMSWETVGFDDDVKGLGTSLEQLNGLLTVSKWLTKINGMIETGEKSP